MAKKKDFIVTEEMIQNASSYIPHARKKAIAKATAKACLEAADKATADIAEETSPPIPQLYREECGAKPLHLMYFFLNDYLRLGLGDEFTEEEFDYYASAHPINQLERLKSGDAQIKNKVFDILYDYKQLKSMIEVEIFNLKETRNNALDRLQDSISLFAAPENIAKLNELMQKNLGELEVAQKKLAQKRGKAKAAVAAKSSEEKKEEEQTKQEEPKPTEE